MQKLSLFHVSFVLIAPNASRSTHTQFSSKKDELIYTLFLIFIYYNI